MLIDKHILKPIITKVIIAKKITKIKCLCFLYLLARCSAVARLLFVASFNSYKFTLNTEVENLLKWEVIIHMEWSGLF